MTDTSRSRTDDRDEQTRRDQDMNRDQDQSKGGISSDKPEEDTGFTTDQDLRDDL